MTLTMYEATVPVFAAGLRNLASFLEKGLAQAPARGLDPTALLVSRLAPDMFPLTRQVQLATDFAKGAVARLAGQEPPVFEDAETTAAELQVRIARTLEFIEGVPAEAFDGADARTITMSIGGKPMSFDAKVYLLKMAVPNFYFHITTAYALLRQQGLELGKRDFLGPIPGL